MAEAAGIGRQDDAITAGRPRRAGRRSSAVRELFPDDVPRVDYTRDELEHLLPNEMSDVIDWWTEEWGVDGPAENDTNPADVSREIAFVLHAQGLYDGWVAAVDEIHEAAVEYDDERTCLEAMRMVELRQLARRLPIQPCSRSKQDTVEALVECLEWF